MLKRKNNIYIKSFAAVFILMLSACSADDVMPVAEATDKTPIELTVDIVGDNSGATTRAGTRTVVTTDNPYGQSAQAFGAATSLYMVMKCDKETATTSTKYARTIGTVNGSTQDVSFATGYMRYYEDACPTPARDAKVSIYSACVPGKANAISIDGVATGYDSNSWTTTAPPTEIVWPLGRTGAKEETNQNTTDFIANQDLCFSNNISNISAENRIRFNTNSNKFTTDHTDPYNDPERGGKMIFYHALTWITFHIVEGAGFDASSATDFAFSNANENMELIGFNTSGTLTLTTGEFTSVGTETIKQLALTEDNRSQASPAYAYCLDGYLVPGSDLNGSDKDDIDKINFTIDHNTYHITKAQLVTALSGQTLTNTLLPALEAVGDQRLMRRGVHYIFTLTINKKAVTSISAALVPWETVSATNVPTNAKITIDLLDNGTKLTVNSGDPVPFDLYRLVHTHTDIEHDHADYEWMKDNGASYADTGNKATLSGTGPYVADDWYWTNNKTFYHFRTVKPTTMSVTNDDTDGDYITLAMGTAPGTANYTDVCWGAPFTNISVAGGARLEYTFASGFDKKTGTSPDYTYSQIYKAIGPTTGTINMEMFHMMSDVSIVLQTTATNALDHVNLDGATLTLTNIYPTGKVRMGNGKVEPDGTPATIPTQSTALTMTYDSSTDKSTMAHFGFVPQDLTNVKLIITTADHNQYEVTMKDVVISGSYSNRLIANPYSVNNKVDRWYPNFEYTYTFRLTKKGITNIEATLANWETVTAGDDNVQIQ